MQVYKEHQRMEMRNKQALEEGGMIEDKPQEEEDESSKDKPNVFTSYMDEFHDEKREPDHKFIS